EAAREIDVARRTGHTCEQHPAVGRHDSQRAVLRPGERATEPGGEDLACRDSRIVRRDAEADARLDGQERCRVLVTVDAEARRTADVLGAPRVGLPQLRAASRHPSPRSAERVSPPQRRAGSGDLWPVGGRRLSVAAGCRSRTGTAGPVPPYYLYEETDRSRLGGTY